MKKKKERFEVLDHETVDDCLNRMKEAGYIPVARVEKPIFQEVKENGVTNYKPVKQKIIFEGRLIE